MKLYDKVYAVADKIAQRLTIWLEWLEASRYARVILRRALLYLAAFLPVAAFTLYYAGVYDIAFIKRPAAWADNLQTISSYFDYTSPTGAAAGSGEGTSPDDSAAGAAGSTDKTDGAAEDPADTAGGDGGSGKDTKPNVNYNTVFATEAELKSYGYSVTDTTYSGETHALGTVSLGFGYPTEFSYGTKVIPAVSYVKHDDGSEMTAKPISSTIDRPALDVYMGLLIYDDRGTQYLVNTDGAVLCSFDDGEYKPAYTRDIYGNPLFYQLYKYNVTAASNFAWEAGGTANILSTKVVSLTGKQYFRLSDDGTSIVKSDYIDSVQNRGLYFDYPAYYGLADNGSVRNAEVTECIVTDASDMSVSERDDVKWTYTYGGKTGETAYSYAANFSGGYACVIDTTLQELRFMNTAGAYNFDTKKKYVGGYERYVSDRTVLPASFGIESLGSLYYSYGYVRVRKQTYDYNAYDKNRTISIISDRDALIDTRGNEFAIPPGYTLVAYSDGILTLEKNGLYGYMNRSGAWIAQPKYKAALPFSEGLGVLTAAGGRMGIVDMNGDTVVPFRYNYISNVSSGVITAYTDSTGWTVFHKMTK